MNILNDIKDLESYVIKAKQLNVFGFYIDKSKFSFFGTVTNALYEIKKVDDKLVLRKFDPRIFSYKDYMTFDKIFDFSRWFILNHEIVGDKWRKIIPQKEDVELNT